jgi:predicted HNH restriction endonuclease
MFEKLIRYELPTTLAQLYAIAQEQQPEDCQGPLCTHRTEGRGQPEWKHQLRRELSRLAVSDGRRNGLWQLSSVTKRRTTHKEDGNKEFLEGRRRLIAAHEEQERNRALRAAKLKQVRKQGLLKCEACKLDFETTYNGVGEHAAEVHHRNGFAGARGTRSVPLEELAVLCANCHRVIHQTAQIFNVAEFSRGYVRHSRNRSAIAKTQRGGKKSSLASQRPRSRS